jgi:hypothetical protein
MEYTKKEEIGHGILAILLISVGIYSLITGVGGGTPGTSSTYTKGIFSRFVGLLIAIAGVFMIKSILTSPTVLKSDSKE